jgi:GTP cyclohydrolase II
MSDSRSRTWTIFDIDPFDAGQILCYLGSDQIRLLSSDIYHLERQFVKVNQHNVPPVPSHLVHQERLEWLQ